MAQFPALPLWTDAYIADCSHLTFAEHGAYLSILLLMWRSPECRVPNDNEWIMRKLRCDADAMRTHVRSVMREFCEIDGNWVIQKRLLKEWHWCKDKRQKNSVSAKSRWEKENKSSERSANGHANAMPPYPSLTLPTPTEVKEIPIGISISKPTRKSRRQLPEQFPLPADLVWAQDLWLKHGRAELCASIGEQVERFRDHHSGKLTASADWPGSWRTWARNAIKFNNGGHNGRLRKSTSHDDFIAAAYEVGSSEGD